MCVSYTVFEIQQVLCRISQIFLPHIYLEPSLGVTSLQCHQDVRCQTTRGTGLPQHIIICPIHQQHYHIFLCQLTTLTIHNSLSFIPRSRPTYLWPPYIIGRPLYFCPVISLWSPCVIGQTIIFLPCDFYLLMASLCNRGGPLYFCPVVSFFFLLLSSSFFPRLISAAVDWMSTILLHMVWPQCEFRMQV